MGSATGAESYLAIIKQSPATPLVIPATPTMQKIAFSTSDIGQDITTTKSKNITGKRGLSGVSITGVVVAGSFAAEMTYEGSLDDELILGALMVDAWTVNVAKNGNFYQPFYIERGHGDISKYLTYLGMQVGQWNMTYSDQALVTNSFTFLGLQEDTSSTPTADATYVDATDNPVFSTVSNVSDIKIDGSASGDCDIKEWDLTLVNNLTGKTGVSKFGACSTNAHKLDISGKLTMYFSNFDMYDRLKAGTPFSFGWTVTDANGKGYTFLLPVCQLLVDKLPIPDEDSDIMEDAEFTALMDGTGTVIQITRIP